jgi:Tol biopolymer transport system component
MVFSSDRTVPRSLFRQATDGSGTAERLTEATYPQNATSWSPDGRWLAFMETHPETRDDIWVLPLEGARRPKPFLQTRASEQSAVFSPDGRWIAYSSDESGRREVFVAAFPGPGSRKQVSTKGGELPFFSRDGRKVFYRLGDQMLAADMVTEPALSFGPPYVAFENLHIQLRNTGLPNFVLGPTGDTLLAVKEPEDNTGTTRVHVVVNWFEELRRLAAK